MLARPAATIFIAVLRRWRNLFFVISVSFYSRRLILLSHDGRAGFEEMPRLIHRLVLGHAPDIRRVRR